MQKAYTNFFWNLSKHPSIHPNSPRFDRAYYASTFLSRSAYGRMLGTLSQVALAAARC